MQIGPVRLTDRVLVIAEVGTNHEGDMDLARRHIHAAAACGADAVKFQTIDPDLLERAPSAERRARLERVALPADTWPVLAAEAAESGVLFLSTPLYPAAVDLLAPLVPAIKVAGGDNDFLPLIDRAARTGRPILLSTGLLDRAATARILHRISWVRMQAGLGSDPMTVLLHCVTSYPVPDEQANLSALIDLATLSAPIGYSDHTLGSTACLGAVALGARVIEKHFTLSHALSDHRDHALSAEPEEFAAMVRGIRRLERMLGRARKEPQPCEIEILPQVRRSIVAARDIPPGTALTENDLCFLRRGGGLACTEIDRVIGTVTRTPLRAGDPIDQGAVQPPPSRTSPSRISPSRISPSRQDG